MSATFWTYKDAAGVDVIVQRFEDVPAQYRSKATTLNAAATEPKKKAGDVEGHLPPAATEPRASLAGPAGLHMPSVLAGATGALVVAMIVTLVFGRRGKLVLGLLMVVALVMGYLTFMRQEVGLGAEVASPAAIVEDAKAAADAMKKQMDKQAAALREATGEK